MQFPLLSLRCCRCIRWSTLARGQVGAGAPVGGIPADELLPFVQGQDTVRDAAGTLLPGLHADIPPHDPTILFAHGQQGFPTGLKATLGTCVL